MMPSLSSKVILPIAISASRPSGTNNFRISLIAVTRSASVWGGGEGDAGGDYDEAFIRHPETGARRECWDVGGDDTGDIAIYTALADPIMVPRDYPIEVR